MLYFFEYMIYTHFSVIIPFCWPNTHNSPIKSWPTHQFHLELFSRGAAAAFRAFGRKLPQNSTWSGQNGLLAKKKKSLFAGTTCKGCRFVKVGWFWDVWFVKGDEGWMIDDFWICPKAPQLGGYIYKQMSGRMIFEWMLTGRSWWVQPPFGWFCLGWLFSDGCKAWYLKKMFTTLLRAWWGSIHGEFLRPTNCDSWWFIVFSILNPRYLHPFLAGIFSSWVVVTVYTFPVEPLGATAAKMQISKDKNLQKFRLGHKNGGFMGNTQVHFRSRTWKPVFVW